MSSLIIRLRMVSIRKRRSHGGCYEKLFFHQDSLCHSVVLSKVARDIKRHLHISASWCSKHQDVNISDEESDLDLELNDLCMMS